MYIKNLRVKRYYYKNLMNNKFYHFNKSLAVSIITVINRLNIVSILSQHIHPQETKPNIFRRTHFGLQEHYPLIGLGNQ